MFEEICGIFEQIEATTKRLIINDILVEFFVKMMKDHPAELVPVVYLCLCRVRNKCPQLFLYFSSIVESSL